MGIITPRVGGIGGPTKVTGSIATGIGTNAPPVINAAGTKMYMANGTSVKVINLANNTVSNTMTTSYTMYGALGIWGTSLYAPSGDPNNSTSSIFSLTTESYTGAFYVAFPNWPTPGFAKNATGLFLVSNNWYGSPARYYSNVQTVAGTGGGALQVGDNQSYGGATYANCLAATSTKLYASGQAVAVVDIASWTHTKTISAYGGYGIAANPAGTKVYVTNGGSNVAVIDTATDTVSKTITGFSTSYGVTFNNAGTKAYVANYYGESISVIDVATDTVTRTISVDTGLRPTFVTISPDDSTLYVTYNNSTGVTVIGGIGSSPASLEVPTSLVRSSVR